MLCYRHVLMSWIPHRSLFVSIFNKKIFRIRKYVRNNFSVSKEEEPAVWVWTFSLVWEILRFSFSHAGWEHFNLILQTDEVIYLSPFIGVHQKGPSGQFSASSLFLHGCHLIQSSSTCFPTWSRVSAPELCSFLKVRVSDILSRQVLLFFSIK